MRYTMSLPMPGRFALRLAFAFVISGIGAPAWGVSEEEVLAYASQGYAKRIAALREAHALDAGAAFTRRVQRITDSLIVRAAADYPETANWSWEVHTTTDPDQSADCMAGGKLLVGQKYAEQLELSDAELAMLLAHEIAHAALHHNIREYEQALRLQPDRALSPFAELHHAVDHDRALKARLAPLNFAQEGEADRAGLLLAWRAGWPPLRLANYFRKMMRNDGQPNFDSRTHPSPASRWRAARQLAEALDARAAQGPAQLFDMHRRRAED